MFRNYKSTEVWRDNDFLISTKQINNTFVWDKQEALNSLLNGTHAKVLQAL